MMSSVVRRCTQLTLRRAAYSPLVGRTFAATRAHLAPAPGKTFEKNPSGKHSVSTIDFDIEDESDLIELAKEEEEEMAKGPEDVIIPPSRAAKGEGEARTRVPKVYTEKAVESDGIEFDIEDESDLIEVGKEEAQEMDKQFG